MKDKNKIIIFISVVILLLIGLFLFARPSANREGSTITSDKNSESVNINTYSINDVLANEERVYDFGRISMKDGLVEHVFTITNSSSEDIFVKRIYTSCMCTEAYLEGIDVKKGPFGMEGMGYLPPANETIKTGETRNVRVVYDPNAHGPAGVGMIDRFVYLEDASRNQLQLEIKANVTP